VIPARIEILAPSLSPTAVEAFTDDVTLFAEAYEDMRQECRIPGIAVTVVLADDFVGEVNSRTHPEHQPAEAFTAERVGSVVMGKNLPQSGDGSEVTVIFNSLAWAGDLSVERGSTARIVAHELAHPLHERIKRVSGALDGVVFPSVTGTELARSSARVMVGEYQADRLADLLISRFFSVTIDGQTQPYSSWTFEGGHYIGGLAAALESVYPSWPDLVDEYRNWRMELGAMFGSVCTSIDQTLTLTVHAQAMADQADAGLDVLDHEAIRDLPVVRLYLGDPFAPFLAELRELSLMPTVEQALDIERRIVGVGAEVTFAIWRKLGLQRLEKEGAREWGLRVTEPLR
jgi:hypothetical protein